MEQQPLIPDTPKSNALTEAEFIVWGGPYGFSAEFLHQTYHHLFAARGHKLPANETFGHGISYFVQKCITRIDNKTSWCIFTSANHFVPVATVDSFELVTKICDLLNKENATHASID